MKYNALKGVHDIFPPEIYSWLRVEQAARETFSAYGFHELRAPVIESTDLFVRSIGETTDIVEKEMYTFEDKAGRRVTLRPEGTAPVVRCYVEHHLYLLPSPQKFFYCGPMFRYERPQAGRFRQFYQIGAEAFGIEDPLIDAEILAMLKSLFETLGLENLNVEVNSIGCTQCRPGYRSALLEFFSSKAGELCSDCRRRIDQNPLRILDCKAEKCVVLRAGAPRVTDFLCGECSGHFESLLGFLKLMEIPHVVNPNMVRGLDYYTRTTFEVTCTHLGAQNAVAAGGRYDRLVEEFGGPPTPAIGFAIGMERITSLLGPPGQDILPVPCLFIATLGSSAEREGALLAARLRRKGIWVETGYSGTSLKSQMRKADRLAARYVLIIGENELSSGKMQCKRLSDGSQEEVLLENAVEYFSSVASECKRTI